MRNSTEVGDTADSGISTLTFSQTGIRMLELLFLRACHHGLLQFWEVVWLGYS